MTRTSLRTRYGLLTALPLVVCALLFWLTRQQRADSVTTSPAAIAPGAPAATVNQSNAPAPSTTPTTSSSTQPAANDRELKFVARTRREVPGHAGRFDVIDTPTAWDARQTAVIICDLWDRHWCDGATQRVGEMAPRVNELVNVVRARGGLIVHGPSDTMKHYAGTAARQLAQDAPPAPGSMPFKWNYLDPSHEGPLPIDDKDGGSDDMPQGPSFHAWTCEHPAVQIMEGDAVSESGQEVFNLFQQRGIQNVLYVGVHLNMCVLGRSFGVRQMTKLGKQCIVVRDLTDTMYNPRSWPFVSHEKGTELMVQHFERYWCPTILSSDILGDPKPPHVVIVAAEKEYYASQTLAAFAKAQLEPLGMRCTLLVGQSEGDQPIKTIQGLDALASADLLILFARRTELPEAQLQKFRAYFDAGKPVVALRTASHAFQNWLEFDRTVLGGHYQNHYPSNVLTHVCIAANAAGDPLLRGIGPVPFESDGSLYRSAPLNETADPLLVGCSQEKPVEPVAWTNTYKGGRIFYTSLGHPDDFHTPQFRRLLLNGVRWALDQPIPLD